MNRLVGAMFGVFIVMLCIMPVMAREDSGTAPMAGGGQSVDIDTQTPVLDGGAFSQYDTVFFHGTMAKANKGSVDVSVEGDYTDCHYVSLYPSAGPAIINCPYVSYDSKKGGIQPMVRYTGLQYKTWGAAEIYAVSVYNGPEWVKYIDFDPPLKSTAGYTLQVIDLGGWYRFNRGLNLCLWTQNPSTTATGNLYIGGYGARYEW